jgi:hypothetical protein
MYTVRALAFGALSSAILLGCSAENYYKSQTGLAYVLDLGDAKTIGAWTLSQNDPQMIIDGQISLGAIMVFRSRVEAQDALNGYVQVHEKLLSGWPGLDLLSRSSLGVSWTLQKMIEASRNEIRAKATTHSKNAAIQKCFARIKRIDRDWAKDSSAG